MSNKFDRLVNLLRELFQLDQPDLDFGLYRIMHAKSDEVTKFLEKDLLPQVKKAFEQYQPADKAAIKKELDQAIAAAKSLGVDPDTNEKVLQLRADLEEGADLNALESEVYDHLYQFFRRYYSDGDFLAKRVYKPGVYAIPYEGEEVLLHWANKDQYYIKTSEYLRDYAFRLKPEAGDAGGDPMRVHFRLVAADEGEHGNIKATKDKDRVFILAPSGESGQDFLSVETIDGRDELVIGFEYRPATMDDWTDEAKDQATSAAKKKPPKQKDLINIAVKTVLAANGDPFDRWTRELEKPHTKINGETADYSRLEGHLNRYTKRHQFDYFIHKDLGGFLRRELDFYIKNEVMHLDDIQSEDAPKVEQYLSKIKVIRSIAHKITYFLDQLEEFQKKLWLKKKFVTETNWCITLDRVPESFYEEIAANDAQRAEWVTLFAIDEITDDELGKVAYAEPLTVEFLKANDKLVLDTTFFPPDFKYRLLAEMEGHEDIDSHTIGLLVHSENFQAIRLLKPRFSNQIKCTYIDPPYNSNGDGFPYKDSYRNSSWLSMLNDRVTVANQLLTSDGVWFSSIDDKDEDNRVSHRYMNMLEDQFGRHNYLDNLIWVKNTTHNDAKTFSHNHEYLLAFSNDRKSATASHDMFRLAKPGCSEVLAIANAMGQRFEPVSKIQEAIKKLYKDKTDEYKNRCLESGVPWNKESQRNNPWKGIKQYKYAEYRSPDGEWVPEESAEALNAQVWVYREDNPSWPNANTISSDHRDPENPEYRFYRPLHPITGKPCPAPARGWLWRQSVNQDKPKTMSFERLVEKHLIQFGSDEAKVPQQKRFLNHVGTDVVKSTIVDFSDGEKELANLFGIRGAFANPKPVSLIRKLIEITTGNGDTVLDYFAGSGTTVHAVIQQNRIDTQLRHYLAVEMGQYFTSGIVPRTKKVIYSPDWKDGKPTTRDTGISHCFKYLRLESYEDALNNLELRRPDEAETVFDTPDAAGLAEQYMLRYMLDVETRGSRSLLNIPAFMDPTAYRLKVKAPGTDESRETCVDLIETFNYLLGLRVSHIAAPQAFGAKFKRDPEGRLHIKGRIKEDPDGPWWFRTVTGTTPDGKRALIIWRKRPSGDEPEGIEKDNAVLDAWFGTQGYSATDSEFDIVWVNGDNNLANLRQEEASEEGIGETGWKVRAIESDFHRFMFDTTDVPRGA